MRFRQERGEYTPSAWLGGGSLALAVAVIPFGIPGVPLVSAIVVAAAFGLVASICFLAAGRQHYLNVGRSEAALAGRSETPPATIPPPEPAPLPRPVPPVVGLVTVEVGVALMATRFAYRRLPAEGKLMWGAVAAIRHQSGPNAVLTAHLLVNGIHAHAVPWVGGLNPSYTIGHAQTGELLLAIHTNYGYYYVLDVGSDGLTHKNIPYGSYTAEVEIDVYGGEAVRYVFNIGLTKDRTKMTVDLAT